MKQARGNPASRLASLWRRRAVIPLRVSRFLLLAIRVSLRELKRNDYFAFFSWPFLDVNSLTVLYYQGTEPQCSNHEGPGRVWTLDYIWFDAARLKATAALETVSKAAIDAYTGLPNQFFPSDHLSLKAHFKFAGKRQSAEWASSWIDPFSRKFLYSLLSKQGKFLKRNFQLYWQINSSVGKYYLVDSFLNGHISRFHCTDSNVRTILYS